MSNNTSEWIEKDTPKYLEFIENLETNHKLPFNAHKKYLGVICWHFLTKKQKDNHLYHNNYILTSVHFRNENGFLKLGKKHGKVNKDGGKVVLGGDDRQRVEEIDLGKEPNLNDLAKDLNRSNNLIVIREAEPGIPAVVRKAGDIDEYGGTDLANNNTLNLDFDLDLEGDIDNKKVTMEAKEIEYRQEKNIEELQRIGIFIHVMNKKNRNSEKKIRQMEIELKTLSQTLSKLFSEVESKTISSC